VRRRPANIQAVRGLSGETQTGHTPRSVETPTDSQWQVTRDHNRACARSDSIPSIHVIRYITNSEVKELRCQARVHREWAGYAFGQCSQKTTHLSLAHDFCGRRCAGAFNNNNQRPSHSRSSLPPNDSVCSIPECRNRAYVEDNGNATQFCSHRHRRYVPLSGCYPRSWLMSHGTFSAAVQRGMVDACLSCVLKLRETCQTWRLVHGSHKVARKCQRLRSVTSKATSVLGIAARPRSVEVSYSLPEVPSLRFIVVLI